MRFVLYNIRYGAGTGARFHLPVPCAGYLKRSTHVLKEITTFIRKADPDIIGLIEVDGGSYRTNKICQANWIADELGHHHIFESKYGQLSVVDRLPILNRQGNAILSRSPIIEHQFHYFDRGVKRLVIEAGLPLVTVFLVHLSLTYRSRQYQLERLHRLVRHVRGPVIVAGDFNLLWGQRELSLFLSATGLRSANVDGFYSYPSKDPKKQLDFILYSSDIVINRFEIPNILHSDHVPLICDFDFL